MSFLKQLLTPFVEFDEDAKKKEEAAKGSQPTTAPASVAASIKPTKEIPVVNILDIQKELGVTDLRFVHYNATGEIYLQLVCSNGSYINVKVGSTAVMDGKDEAERMRSLINNNLIHVGKAEQLDNGVIRKQITFTFEKKDPLTPTKTISFAELMREGNVLKTASSNIDENAHHPLIDGENKPANTTDQIPTYSPSGSLSKPLPEHEQYFEKLIDDANRTNLLFQGADYKEFVDSKLDIDDIQDEELKYKTAFNVLKNSGLTKGKLLSTGQEYLNIIGRDMNAFQGAQSLQYNKEVRPKEQLIQQKAEELQQLTQRMYALKNEINALTQDINLAKEKFNTTRNSFLLAGEKKQKEIEAELQKIAKYF